MKLVPSPRIRQILNVVGGVLLVASVVMTVWSIAQGKSEDSKFFAFAGAVAMMLIFLLMRLISRLQEQLTWLTNVTLNHLKDLEATPTNAASSPDSTPVARWPWGEHTTNSLEDLKVAGEMFWARYDPTEPGTAPTNAMVVEWLMTKRGTSANNAQAIASILRADGLKPGPRR